MQSLLRFVRKRWWVFALLIGVAVAGGYWWWQQQKPEDVSTTSPEYRDITKTLEFTGVVDAHERVRLRFAAGGKVIYLGAQEGELVKKGQTLASLDKRSMQKGLEKQLSLYQTQRWTFEENEDQRDEQVLELTDRREADKDQFALNRSVLDVEIQSLAIESAYLTSPIDGVLVDSPLTVTGVQLAATDYFEVANPDTLYFQLFVDEVDIDEVFAGQKAWVRLDANPDEALSATVTDVAYRSAQASSGTVFPVDLQFDDPVSITDQRLGMNGEAELVLATKQNVLSVPVESLISREGTTYVEVLENGEVQSREVEIGLESDTYVEVVSGLTVDDQVVLP